MRLGFLSGRHDADRAGQLGESQGGRPEPSPTLDVPPPRLPSSSPAAGLVMTGAADAPMGQPVPSSPEQALLARIGDFRESVASDLYERSSDYQILCHLAHSDLRSSQALMDELRLRLSRDVHYCVLAKLDEAYALVEARLASSGMRQAA